MAVIKAKREENPLEVLTKSRELVCHTITLCKTEKHFPKRDRWILTTPIVKSALKIYQKIRKANAVKVVTEADYRRRMNRQKKALEELDNLLGLIDIADAVANISGESISHWIGLCKELRDMTRAWHRSDQTRLKKEINDSLSSMKDTGTSPEGL